MENHENKPGEKLCTTLEAVCALLLVITVALGSFIFFQNKILREELELQQLRAKNTPAPSASYPVLCKFC